MGLYTGFDLYSSNTYVGIIDDDGKRIWKRKSRNDPSVISSMLKPFKKDAVGIVVQSTYNWYELVRAYDGGELPCALGQSSSDRAVFGTQTRG